MNEFRLKPTKNTQKTNFFRFFLKIIAKTFGGLKKNP